MQHLQLVLRHVQDQNKLQDLPPKVFDSLELDRLNLQNNNLIQLHAGTFQGLTFGRYCSRCILDMSQNQLQVLHAEAFQGLKFGQNGILDMSQNKLQDLPPKVFDSLELDRLYLQNNLIQLHAGTFQGLTFGRYCSRCILDMSQNQLHAEAFQGLKFGQNGILDMSASGTVPTKGETLKGSCM